MSELFGAIDETLDGDYLAVVVGDNPSVSKNSRFLPEHLAQIRYSTEYKKLLLEALDFNGTILVHCINYGLKTLRDIISDRISTGKLRTPLNKINRHIAYAFISSIEKNFGYFAISNHTHLQDIDFEVDNGIIKGYLITGGFSVTDRRNTHKIADSVAYANFRGWKIERVIEHGEDFKTEFYRIIMDKLL